MKSRIVGKLGIVVLLAAMLSGCNRGGGVVLVSLE